MLENCPVGFAAMVSTTLRTSVRGVCHRDFLPVLDGKDHLVIIDRDPGEQSADVAFIGAAKRPYPEFGRIYD